MKLTDTMEQGLRKMAKKLERQTATVAEPNDNTGRALEKRGLIEKTDTQNNWNYYQLTDAGRAFLSAPTQTERNEG